MSSSWLWCPKYDKTGDNNSPPNRAHLYSAFKIKSKCKIRQQKAPVRFPLLIEQPRQSQMQLPFIHMIFPLCSFSKIQNSLSFFYIQFWLYCRWCINQSRFWRILWVIIKCHALTLTVEMYMLLHGFRSFGNKCEKVTVYIEDRWRDYKHVHFT